MSKHKLGAGSANLSNAYERALKKADDARMSNLRPLKDHLEGALGVPNLKTTGLVSIVEVVARLRAYLLNKGRAPSYVRNQISTLYYVIRQGKVVPESVDRTDEWSLKVSKAITALEGHSKGEVQINQLTKAAEYLRLFVNQEGVSVADFKSDHLNAYRSFLENELSLNPGGAGRVALRGSKKILAELGIYSDSRVEQIALPRKMLAEIDELGKYATDHSETVKKLDENDDPFRPIEDKSHVIRKITWEVRKGDFIRYLHFWQKKLPKQFSDSTLADWLTVNRVKEYLTIGYHDKRFSAATAETCVSRLVQFYKYAAATRVRGFEKIDEENVKEFRKTMWQLVPMIRKNFRKSTVSDRLKEEGGSPKWIELQSHFGLILKQECKNIAKLQKKAHDLRKSKQEDQAQVIDLRIALRMREIICAATHLYFACRNHDITETITVDHFKKVSDQYYCLEFTPSKTSGQKNPPSVEGCFPPWITPILNSYLGTYQKLIYVGSKLMFPADQRLKTAHSRIAHEGSSRRGNYQEYFQRLSKKFFGKALSVNKMRYSLTGFFEFEGLPGVYRFTGHKPNDRSNLTAIEQAHYLRPNDGDKIRAAKTIHEKMEHYFVEVSEVMKAVQEI